jgi:hypothetical protein
LQYPLKIIQHNHQKNTKIKLQSYKSFMKNKEKPAVVCCSLKCQNSFSL